MVHSFAGILVTGIDVLYKSQTFLKTIFTQELHKATQFIFFKYLINLILHHGSQVQVIPIPEMCPSSSLSAEKYFHKIEIITPDRVLIFFSIS